MWPGHGAGSACGKALGAVPQSTVGYERRFNAGLSFSDESGFVGAILDGQPEPPLYFARMKDLNKNGVPVLGDLPAPKLYTAEELAERGSEDGAVVVDTRVDRKAFMAGHIPGSIHAPMGISFAQIVGSYVQPKEKIFLVADAADIDQAVRTLVRIGYDHIAGYTAPSTFLDSKVADRATPRVDFSELGAGAESSSSTLLDVRGIVEYNAGHVPGAINIAHTRLAQRLGEVPRDKPVFTYCRSGNRAASAASLLEREGYEVTHIDGTYASWPGLEREERSAGVV